MFFYSQVTLAVLMFSWATDARTHSKRRADLSSSDLIFSDSNHGFQSAAEHQIVHINHGGGATSSVRRTLLTRPQTRILTPYNEVNGLNPYQNSYPGTPQYNNDVNQVNNPYTNVPYDRPIVPVDRRVDSNPDPPLNSHRGITADREISDNFADIPYFGFPGGDIPRIHRPNNERSLQQTPPGPKTDNVYLSSPTPIVPKQLEPTQPPPPPANHHAINYEPIDPYFQSNPFIGNDLGRQQLPSPPQFIPFFDSPFIPFQNPPQNNFQRRKLTLTNNANDLSHNSIGFGYPSYNYYKGDDEAGLKWPKIFKFTDGRVNLNDFEKEKKLGKIAFNKEDDYFDNIRRDSFLILHGGAYNYN